jgi:hypothetical protein
MCRTSIVCIPMTKVCASARQEDAVACGRRRIAPREVHGARHADTA